MYPLQYVVSVLDHSQSVLAFLCFRIQSIHWRGVLLQDMLDSICNALHDMQDSRYRIQMMFTTQTMPT